jgi:hypothetical protein
MAWSTNADPLSFLDKAGEPDLDTLLYRITRLQPNIGANSNRKTIVVFNNRCGVEGDTIYVGTSAVIGIESGEISLYGILGRGEKGLLVVDTDATPYAKLKLHLSGAETPESNEYANDGRTSARDSDGDHRRQAPASDVIRSTGVTHSAGVSDNVRSAPCNMTLIISRSPEHLLLNIEQTLSGWKLRVTPTCTQRQDRLGWTEVRLACRRHPIEPHTNARLHLI